MVNKKFSLMLLAGLMMIGQSTVGLWNPSAKPKEQPKSQAVPLKTSAPETGDKKTHKKCPLRNLDEKTGISTKDAAIVIVLSSGYAAANLGINGNNADTQQKLQKEALRASVALAITGITTSQAFKTFAKNVPVVGGYLTCGNADCKGICEQCRLAHSIATVVTYLAADSVINGLNTKYSKNL